MTATSVTSVGSITVEGLSTVQVTYTVGARVTSQAVETIFKSSANPNLRVTAQTLETLHKNPVNPNLAVTSQAIEVIFKPFSGVIPSPPDIVNEIDKFLQSEEVRFEYVPPYIPDGTLSESMFSNDSITVDNNALSDGVVLTEKIADNSVTSEFYGYNQNLIQVGSTSYSNIVAVSLNLSNTRAVNCTATFNANGYHLGSAGDYDYLINGIYWKANTTTTYMNYRMVLSSTSSSSQSYPILDFNVKADEANNVTFTYTFDNIVTTGSHTLYLQVSKGASAGENLAVGFASVTAIETKK